MRPGERGDISRRAASLAVVADLQAAAVTRAPLHPAAPTFAVPAPDLDDLRSLHLLVRAMVSDALRTGPADTVADRLDYDQLRRLGRLADNRLRGAIASHDAAAARYDRETDRQARRTARLVSDLAVASLGNEFDHKGAYVYLLYNEHDVVIYVGQSTNVVARLGDHLRNPDRRHLIHRFVLIRCAVADQMNQVERALITHHQPVLNILGVS